MRQPSSSDSPDTLESSILLHRLTQLPGSKRVLGGRQTGAVCTQEWARNETGPCVAAARPTSAESVLQVCPQSSKATVSNLYFNALPLKGMVEKELGEPGKQITKEIIDIILTPDGSFSTEHSIDRTKAGWPHDTMPARHCMLPSVKTDLSPCPILKPECLLGWKGKQL